MRNLSFIRIILFFVLSVALLSCKKEPDLIGLDLIPEDELLGHEFIDSTTILAYTVEEDTLRTDEMAQHLLGSMADPAFGTTTASIYTQYSLSRTNVDFGENAVADSVILTIPYSGIYGDTLATQQIRVYELSDSISLDSTYYFFSTLGHNPELIGEANFVPNTFFIDTIDNVPIRPHMRVVLSPAFAQRLMTADSNTFSSTTEFKKVFKGLYITAEKATGMESGAIMYLNIINTQSAITLYYHNSTDTSSLKLPINSECARFNHYEHYGYEGADPALLQQLAGDTTAGSEKLFLQSMGGLNIRLRFPYLTDLASRKIAIHEAVLLIESPMGDSTYKIPATLNLRVLDALGEYDLLPDEQEGAVYMGTTAQSYTNYRVRIGRYVQQRLLHPDLPDYGLTIIPGNPWFYANRAIINGPSAEAGQLKLLIYYTPIP